LSTPTKRAEDYLLALSTLRDEGVPPIPARVAEILDVSAPTVTLALRRLERDGLIRWSGRKEIELTGEGSNVARSLQRRHRLIECWLTGVLGLDWATANEEAHHLEHAISPVVEERLMQVMNFPVSCPHGNPIPGEGREQTRSLRLSDLAPGARTRLYRISELAESERSELLFYYEQGFRPEIEITVLAHDGDTVKVQIEDRTVQLTATQASFLWVYAPVPSLAAVG
jgi:DtxR family Mn-dependent transcriptional regulator